MATNRIDPSKPTEDAEKKDSVSAPAKSGGAKPWIPLLANIILMPAIAYGLTMFVLLPKIEAAKGGSVTAGAQESGAHASPGKSGKSKATVPLSGKVLVNVAGTAGTRYLVASMTLVSGHADFKARVEEHDPKLRDAAASILGMKTISDLDKPGIRNVIRAELISAFNDIMGREAVTDIYLTEFAIQ